MATYVSLDRTIKNVFIDFPNHTVFRGFVCVCVSGKMPTQICNEQYVLKEAKWKG